MLFLLARTISSALCKSYCVTVLDQSLFRVFVTDVVECSSRDINGGVAVEIPI